MKGFFKLAVLLLLVPVGDSCQSSANKMRSPAGYNLNKPEVINLTKKIDQISGIVYSASDNSLYAIDDDNGDLYNIPITEHPEIKKWKFGKKADYEDLVMTDSMFYILISNGTIISFPKKFPITDVKERKIDLEGFNEFETLYYDAAADRLLMLCKECNKDDKQTVSIYPFDLSSDSFGQPLKLERKNVEAITKEKTGRLKISGGTINSSTGEVFLVSSINKLLIVTDKDLNVKDAYDLQRSEFEHPEGICFAPDGTLFVSNEASEETKANILIFKKNQ